MFRIKTVMFVIVAAALAIAACAPAPTAVPAAPAPAEPAAPAAPAEPAATEGGAPAAEAGWCSGTKIVFFPGGAAGGGFETVVYNGALAAAADTGADVQYVWSDWNPEKMITQFSEAMATNPDGIAVMGHPGNDAFAPLVDDAEAQGILVTAMNVELPGLQVEIRLATALGMSAPSTTRRVLPSARKPSSAVRHQVSRQGLRLGSGCAGRPW